jgi:glycosyltransferase involved in cell wall biosynthesis
VHDLPAVTEAEKAWLYSHASAVAYPSVEEGFGLIPFEAARAGVPCLFAHEAALAETLPAEAAVLELSDAASSAERALPLLRQGPQRERQLELVGAAARRLGDADSARAKLLAVYRQATTGEPRSKRSAPLLGRLRRRLEGLRPGARVNA